jgi:hypothetical protein
MHERSDLQAEIRELQRTQKRNPRLTEYIQIQTRLSDLISDGDRLEDELAQSLALNSILVERISSRDRVKAYRDNQNLRNKKLELFQEIHQYSEETAFLANFRRDTSRTQSEIPDARKSYRAADKQRLEIRSKLGNAKAERHRIMINHITSLFSETADDIEREISELRQREAELDSPRWSRGDGSDGGFLDASLELREFQCEILKLEQQLGAARMEEMELRYENEALELRQNTVPQIDRLKSDQIGIRDRFLRVQLHWNDSMCQHEHIFENEELGELEERFSELSDQVESIIAEEAEAERELLDREYDETQHLDAEIRKMIADQDVAVLASQARLEALKLELGVDEDLEFDVDNAAEEVAQLNAAQASAEDGVQSLNVMLRGELGDELSRDEKFESIRDRIRVCLQPDRPLTELNRLERQLRERIQRLRRRT